MKLLNTNRFYLRGTDDRFVHLASIQDGLREFICFFDLVESKCYIEEIKFNHLTFVDDDRLVEDINSFLIENHVTDITHGLPIPD